MILNCSQCAKGNVVAAYATGKILSDIGVVPGGDMSIECAMVKLAFVLVGLLNRKLLKEN